MTNLLSAAAGVEGAVVERRALYLLVDPDPVWAVLHVADRSATSTTGVVFCPPFGWDEICAHRSLRNWADTLAAAGLPALRIDLPATGDSGGSPRDSGRLDAWTGSVTAAARWMRSTQTCSRVVAIGIGLGGMLATRAVALGAPIDDLVLWSVPARGTTLLRELRAFARMARAEVRGADDAIPAPDDDGALEVAGYVLSAETLSDLEGLDLTESPLPRGRGRRILLLARDTLQTDRRLREHLERSDVELTVAEGAGYARMMTNPQFAETPRETFESVAAWLAASTPASAPADLGAAPDEAIVDSDHLDLIVGGAMIRETPLLLAQDGGQLAGVLCAPRSSAPAVPGLCALFLNGGADRRIGPNRAWVESARRWAARGVPSVRLDMGGLGDSDGDEVRYQRTFELYRDEIAEQVRHALDEIEARGLGNRFVVGGLCSGAYWAFHAALADERIRALFLINLWSFFWSEEDAAARDARRARALLRQGAWLYVARIAAQDGRLGRTLRTRLRSALGRSGGTGGDRGDLESRVDTALAQLREREVLVHLLLCEGESLAQDFEAEGRTGRLGEWPNMTYERIPIEDHTFRPVWAQRHVSERLDDALVQVLKHEAAAR